VWASRPKPQNPNPQSPIPNPQSPNIWKIKIIFINKLININIIYFEII